MGVYVEEMYAQYGKYWASNLFYSHFLSLPLFLPLAPAIRRQWTELARSKPLDASMLLGLSSSNRNQVRSRILGPLVNDKAMSVLRTTPRGILYLLINAITQLVCISGVNLLSAQTSAVTVTIVLNIRKLVSFVLSVIVFGNTMSGKMVLGATTVFGAGALYGWETSWRMPRERKRRAEDEGRVMNGVDREKENLKRSR